MLKKIFANKKHIPKPRWGHSSVAVGNKMISWGGMQSSLPEVHSNDLKTRMTSVIEIFDLETGKWTQESTLGQPPLGIRGQSSTTIGEEIYYFGGFCGHDWCRHNTLHCLDTTNRVWRMLEPHKISKGPMKKSRCGMVGFTENGKEYICVFGGTGLLNSANQPHATYIPWKENPNWGWTNEFHTFSFETGEWLSPTITGDVPPACAGFTLTKTSGNTAILYGGFQPESGGCVSDVFIMKMNKDKIHWKKIQVGQNSNGDQLDYPIGRQDHTCACLSCPMYGQDRTILMMIGGRDPGGNTLNDCWLLDLDSRMWSQIFFLDTIAYRHFHSTAVFHLSLSCFLIVVFGGVRGWLPGKKSKHQPAVSATTIIEADATSSGGWQLKVLMEEDQAPSSDYFQLIEHHIKGQQQQQQQQQQLLESHKERDQEPEFEATIVDTQKGVDQSTTLKTSIYGDIDDDTDGEDDADQGEAIEQPDGRISRIGNRTRESSPSQILEELPVPPPLPPKRRNLKKLDELDTSGSTLDLTKHGSSARHPLVNQKIALHSSVPTVASLSKQVPQVGTMGAESTSSDVPLMHSLRENDRHIIQSLEQQLAIAIGRSEEIEEQLHNAVLKAEERAVLAEEKARVAESRLQAAQEEAKKHFISLGQAQDQVQSIYAEALNHSEDILQLQQEALLAEEKVIEAERLLSDIRSERDLYEEESKQNYQSTVRMETKVKELERSMLKIEGELQLANEKILEEMKMVERLKKKEVSQLLIPAESITHITDIPSIPHIRTLSSVSSSTDFDEDIDDPMAGRSSTSNFFQTSSALYCGSKVTQLVFSDFIDEESDQWTILESLKGLAVLRHPNVVLFIGATAEILDGSDENGSEGSEGAPLTCKVSILTEYLPTSLDKELTKGTKFSDQEIISIGHDILSGLTYLNLKQFYPFVNTKLRPFNVLLQEFASSSDYRYKAKITIVEHVVLSASIGDRVPSVTDLSMSSVIKDLGLLLASMITGREVDSSGVSDDELKGSSLCQFAIKCIEDYSILNLNELLLDITSRNNP